MAVAVGCENIKGDCAADMRGRCEKVYKRRRGFIAGERSEDERKKDRESVDRDGREDVAKQEVPDAGRREGGKDVVRCETSVIK